MTLQEHKARESLNDDQYRDLLRFAQEIRRQIECPLHNDGIRLNPQCPSERWGWCMTILPLPLRPRRAMQLRTLRRSPNRIFSVDLSIDAPAP